MKKITLSILMSIAFISLINAQVDKLLLSETKIKSNLSVAEIKNQINNNLNEKKSNFNNPYTFKAPSTLPLTVAKSIPSTKSSSKKFNSNISSESNRPNRFHKQTTRSSTSNRSNTNYDSSRIMDNSIDVLEKLNPYYQIYNNDVLRFDEVESTGNYIEKYTYNDDGLITFELYYDDYDAIVNTYNFTEGYQYVYEYFGGVNLEEVYQYRYDLSSNLWVLTNAVSYEYENDLPTSKTYYNYDEVNGYVATNKDEYSYNDDNLISTVENKIINGLGTEWLPDYAESYLYVSDNIDETYFWYWSTETEDYELSERDSHYFNTGGQYYQVIYYNYNSLSDEWDPEGREQYTYHSGELQENVLSSYIDYYVSADGTEWVADEAWFVPTIYRGYGNITTSGDMGFYDSSGDYSESNDLYLFYSYTPPATITPNYTETFDTFPPQAWEFAQGDYGSPTGVSTNLEAGSFGNDSDSPNGNSAVINIYGDFVADYFGSPVFDLSGGTYFLNYDVALTEWATTNPSTLGADDYVAVLVTQDRGVSWTELYRWDANTEISNDGQSATEIIMTGYGAEVQFAFYANSGVSDIEDNDFFIDNFQITSETLSTSTNTLEGFTIYPTIVKEELNFTSQNKVEAVTVFNLLGQKVFFGAPNTNNSSINLSKLRPGIYVVKVSSEGKIGSYKIIKE